MRFILGAHGGAKGFNPFPARPTDRHVVRRYTPQTKAAPALEINHSEQPWQKAARKQEERQEKRPNLHPLARRQAREARRAEAMTAKAA